VKWLREHIGTVSQEPILFALSIKDNIKMGRENVTDEELYAAAKQLHIQSVPIIRGVVSSNLDQVSDLRQGGGFLRVLRFPPPIKLTTTI
jgi:ABC-type transport system involved in cytochrome bd biosynthesis fused ATPase/permease subunit